MVVRELIHLQQGPQDQLPVQPFSFLEGALCGMLLWANASCGIQLSGVASCVATTVFLIGELLGPGAESSALPLPSLPGFTGYGAVQNRFSGQVGVNFKTLEAMGHCRSWPAPVTDRPSTDLNLLSLISIWHTMYLNYKNCSCSDENKGLGKRLKFEFQYQEILFLGSNMDF